MRLTDLGLTEMEAKAYSTLLREGPSRMASLARVLEMHRATAYAVLDRLIEKGLASVVVHNKRKHFEAVAPERFLDLLREKQEALAQQEKEVGLLVKELVRMRRSAPGSSIKVLAGKEGLKALMQRLLEANEFLVLGGEVKFSEYLPIYTQRWARERERCSIRARILTSKPDPHPWRLNICRRLPKNVRFPTSTILFSSTVAFVLPEEPLKVVLLESKPTFDAYSAYFEMLWESRVKKSE